MENEEWEMENEEWGMGDRPGSHDLFRISINYKSSLF